MFERDVTVSLNADVSNYTSSLSQAIAITQQYGAAADTALGGMAKLNAGFVQGLIKVTSGFTGPQKVATDAAAAYQQQLAGLQATASVTGQNFGQLEKSTKSLARAFPIGMTQAVQQVQALQSAGVTSNKEIEKLGISFTKLGAANGAFGPELGQQMLQVTRQFGNSTSQIDALGDSLTSVSKMWGANASSVLSFSKALAPIASTVGMSQTSVMGLSTAMSRLGEDGYAAANSFNKVLLDMNQGIRKGGPELKIYADLLNMTSDSLKSLFKSDPTEVLVRFTEAVSKAGPAAQSTLEALGLDGVRTTRSISALSNSGDLRQIINTSVSQYGSGSTDKAAAEALGGVNDQMTRLTESMRQTVGAAGKPFLGFMEDVLKVSNKVSDVTNNVMDNDWVQKIATYAVPVGVAATMAMKGLTFTTLASAGKNIATAVRDSKPVQDLRGAQQAARAGVMPGPGATVMQRVGGAIGQAQGPVPVAGTATTIGQRVSATINAAGNMTSRLLDSQTNEALKARGAQVIPVTPTGAALRTAAGDLLRQRDMASLRAFGGASQMYLGGMGAQGGLRGALGSAALYGVETTRTAAAGLSAGGRVALSGLRAIGGSGLGQMALLGGAVAAGTYMYQTGKENAARLDNIQSGSNSDIFASFNQFAEAAGQAGKGLVNFSAAVSQATNNLARQNKTLDQATKLTPEESAQAMSPGYTPAFKIVGDAAKGGANSPKAIAQQAVAMLGPMAQPEDIARVVSDVANQTNRTIADQVGQEIKKTYSAGGAASMDVGASIADILANTSQNPFGYNTSEESAQLATNMGKGLAAQSYRVSSLYGDQAGQIANLDNAQTLYEQARGQVGQDPNAGTDIKKNEAAMNVSKVLQAQLGLTNDQMDYVMGDNGWKRSGNFQNMSFDDVIGRLQQYAAENPNDRPSILDTVDQKQKLGPDYLASFKDRTELEKKSYDLQDSFKQVTKTGSTLSETLYGVNDAARNASLTLSELSQRPDAQKTLTQPQKLVLEAATNQNEGTVNAAAMALARQAMSQSRGNVSVAQARLQQEAATAMEGTPFQAVAQASLQQLQTISQPRLAAMPQTKTMLQTVQQGRSAEMMGQQSDQALEKARQDQMAAGSEQRAAFTSMARNFLLQQKQMEVQMQQMREQAGQQTYQMTRDYNLQVQYANEDFSKNKFRSTRDFNISMGRMERDYNISQSRATRDFTTQAEFAQQDYNKQRKRATQDYNLSVSRMREDATRQEKRVREDYQRGVERSERDYQKARGRTIRDFGIQMARMEDDYNKQRSRATSDYERSVSRSEEDYRTGRARAARDFARQQAYSEADYFKGRARATEDFNKQLRRLVEDQAKSVYDPYKRIQAQLVMDSGQLVANLASQNTAIRKQMESLDSLRGMGLSSQAIDVLGLGDSKNAQQVQRLLSDTITNPAMIQQINEQIAGRIDLTKMMVSDPSNTQVRRMTEDFGTQMKRAEEDYTTSSARAAEQFSTSMDDMQADFTKQLARAAEDFNTAMSRMGDDYATAVLRAKEDQARALDDMMKDHLQALSDAEVDFHQTLSRMGEDYATAVSRAAEDFGKAMSRMEEDYATSVGRMYRMFMRSMRDAEQDFKKVRHDAREDFKKQMADAEEDFQKQMSRMATSYANALSDIGAGLAIAERAAAQSLIAYGQTVAQGERGIFKSFAEYIAGLPKDMQDNMGESMRGMLKYMRDQFPGLFAEYFPNGIAGLVLGSGTVPTPQQRDEGAGPVKPPNPDPLGVNGVPGSYVTPPTDPLGVNGVPGSYVTPAMKKAWYDQWVEVGKSGIEGLAEGLAWANPANWARDIADGVIWAFKSFFGIQSPSKVFASMGKDLMSGLAKGIVDNVPGMSWLKDKLSPIFDGPGGLSGYLKGIPSSISDWIGSGNILSSIVKVLPISSDLKKSMAERFTEFNKFFDDLPDTISKAIGDSTIFKSISSVFPTAKTLLNAVTGFFKDTQTYFEGLPAAIAGWIKGKNSILDYIIGEFPTVKALENAVTAIIEGKDGKGGIKGVFANLGENIKTWISKSGIADAFSGFYKAINNTLYAIVNGWNQLNPKISISIPDWVPVYGGKTWNSDDLIPNINPNPYRLMAEGGVVQSATRAIVGEAGPEAVVPLNQRGAQVMADAMKRYLTDQAFNGSLANPTVINVQMADVNIDFTDSGSEFESQTQELLQRVRDAARLASDLVNSMATKITRDVDDVSKSLEDLADVTGKAFVDIASSIEDALKGASGTIETDNKSIADSFATLTDAMDTDLSDLVTGFSTSVDTIITDLDALIRDAIQRIEDFANTDWVTTDPGGGGGGGDTNDGGNGGGGGGGNTNDGTGNWNSFAADYQTLGAPDQTFIDGLFGGKKPTEAAFNALSGAQQTALKTSAPGGLTTEERASLTAAFQGGGSPGGGSPGGGTPGGGRNTSYANFNTLQRSLGAPDKSFLTTAFGGKLPTSSGWSSLSQRQRDVLIDALEDKDISASERSTIGGLGLSTGGNSGGGAEGGNGSSDPAKSTWTAFRSGYDQLGDNDKARVDRVFGGKPTFESWSSLTETQQRRMRDIVRDGSIGKDESDDFNAIAYKTLGQQIVRYASTFDGAPYKPEIGKKPSEDPANPPKSFDCSKFTSYVYAKFGKTLPTYSDSQFFNAGGKNVDNDPLPGDLVFFHSDGPWRDDNPVTGHVGIYAGGGKMWDAAGAATDTGLHSVSGEVKGYRRYFAEGGVVASRQDAVIGEAGPEAVLPLNERGAAFFTSVMQRYAAPNEARQAMVSPYSTPVNVSINQTYDNRTMFTGPIEVAANDPDEFASKAAAKQRRQRLSQPLGSSR